MKKGIILIVALVGLTFNNVNAQSKFGYVNAAELLYLMPQMKTVNHVLDSFQVALDSEYKVEVGKYQELEAKLKKQIDDKASEALINLTQQELQDKADFLQKASQAFQDELVEKQNKLLTPLNEKIMTAIKEVAKEKGMNYIFDISKGAVLYWDEADDVNKDVRKKLGISETATLPANGGQ